MATINNSLNTVTSGETTGVQTAENKVFYNRTLLTRLVDALVYAKHGQKKSAPKHEGDTMDFRRFEALDPVTDKLVEGVTPDGSNFKVSNLRATVEQYGDYVIITDQLDLMGIDPVITEMADVLGEQAALTIDNKVKDVIFAGTNVQYVGGGASRSALGADNVITGAEVKKAVRTLRNNKVKPAQGGYYIGFIDPSCAYDLMEDKLWQDVSKYNGGEKIMKGEIGKIHGVRFIETSNPAVFEGSVEVHGTLIFGEGAYGVVDIEGSVKPEVIIKPQGTLNDPLNQRSSIGWKALFKAVRLQELAMVRIESAVSA